MVWAALNGTRSVQKWIRAPGLAICFSFIRFCLLDFDCTRIRKAQTKSRKPNHECRLHFILLLGGAFFLHGKDKLFPGLNEAMNVEALLCYAIYSRRQSADSADVGNGNSFIVLHETQFERSIFCISLCIVLYRVWLQLLLHLHSIHKSNSQWLILLFSLF